MKKAEIAQKTEVKPVIFDSNAYRETVQLRFEVLRKPLGLDFTPEQLTAEASDFHFALYINNELGACLILSRTGHGDELKMRQVAVKPALQGKGLGKILVNHVEVWAAAEGFKTIVLNARETAVPFYLQQEYILTGAPFTEVGIPHRKMLKKL